MWPLAPTHSPVVLLLGLVGGVVRPQAVEGRVEALAGNSVGWRCSVEGNTWVDRTLGATGPTAGTTPTRPPRPDGLCTPIKDRNCYGNDLNRLDNVSDATACCAACQSNSRCFAWTYDTTPVHSPYCFLKSNCNGPNKNQGVVVVSGFATAPPSPPAPPPPAPAGVQLNISVSTTAHGQTMEGFGGCFNEKGWDALAALNASAQAGVMRALFDPTTGLKYNKCRMPIGASDFADDYYSLDDTANDTAIQHLNLTRDREKLIPYIKAAMAVQPDLRVWGSPWTAPVWMKQTAGCVGGSILSTDTSIRASYALYLARAAKAYRAEGLAFEDLAIQNEPNQDSACGAYPKMGWTGDDLHTFLRDHLGPAFASERITDQVGIFLATFPVNDFAGFVNATLADPAAATYLSGIGLQYGGVGMVPSIRSAATGQSLRLWETETPCGGGRARDCGNGPGTRNNSWAWGESQFAIMRSFIESGVSLYSQWNMILDQTGSSGWGWAQCSPVTIDTHAQTVTYEGSFWATKHYSFYVAPGAVRLLATGDTGACESVNGACGCASCGHSTYQATSFLNPDGEVVVVVLNGDSAERPLQLSVDGKVHTTVVLPAHSMNTFTIPPAVSVD